MDHESNGNAYTCVEMLCLQHGTRCPNASLQSHGKRSWKRYKCLESAPQSCQYFWRLSTMSESSPRPCQNLSRYSRFVR